MASSPLTDRVKKAARDEMEAHLAYYEAKKYAEEDKMKAIQAEMLVQHRWAEYQKAVLERNQAVVEMYEAPSE